MSAKPQDEGTRLDDKQVHRFGSLHTKLKLDTLGKYLPAFTTALKKTPFTLHYIDAFAGTGVCHIKVGENRLMVPGSASIAISCAPNFDKMVFIEKSLHRAKALERLKSAAPQRDIAIIREDANIALPAYIQRLNPRRDRAIVFLDPYGMQVEWSTLRQIATSAIVDLWYLFPLSGLYRQATRNASAIDESKADSLTRILGTEEWRRAFYGSPAQQDIFGQKGEVRLIEIPQMLEWVKRRLETIFPGVANPKLLHQLTKSGKPGAPIFALFFAVSNPAHNGKALALRIAESVLRR